ncbi:hypothetical protein B9J09_00105 [Xylella fastidiosa subsp. pauca]|nr:hypothetical protein B9J09_00105 [Xylella fastidiosa subsp. pauca]AVI19897.1 hypothetical protein BCV75_00095 [Xylella fastidiosa]AVI21892.1 hypothetical protein BC375_00100 [Xylella fastidiosa]KIA58885.1 hypothetical protein RA12_00125 [Xylella fastidiosa]KXB09888.1 hypothetical protein ADT32_11150 [Xylella fastidiosa]
MVAWDVISEHLDIYQAEETIKKPPNTLAAFEDAGEVSFREYAALASPMVLKKRSTKNKKRCN